MKFIQTKNAAEKPKCGHHQGLRYAFRLIGMFSAFAFISCFFVIFTTFHAASAKAAMKDHPVVKLQSLDKITARTMTFEARVGSTIKFGPLYIKIRACRKAPPIEQPESAAFLQIWEMTPEDEAKWVFSGWMFASSPALSSMDHPIYDVWVIDCLEGKEENPAKEEEEKEENTKADKDASRQKSGKDSAETETENDKKNADALKSSPVPDNNLNKNGDQ